MTLYIVVLHYDLERFDQCLWTEIEVSDNRND